MTIIILKVLNLYPQNANPMRRFKEK